MLSCKHVRLSCVINAYLLTYLLTYLWARRIKLKFGSHRISMRIYEFFEGFFNIARDGTFSTMWLIFLKKKTNGIFVKILRGVSYLCSRPAVWNSLLSASRENMSPATFKTKLKTYLFSGVHNDSRRPATLLRRFRDSGDAM